MSHNQLPQDKGQGTDKPQQDDRINPFHELDDFDYYVNANLPEVSWTALIVSAALITAVLGLVTFI